MQQNTVENWLLSADNPPVRYQTARNLVAPRPPESELARLRRAVFEWVPLQTILGLQLSDGSFPHNQKTPTAQPTFSALLLMERCGLDINDEPVAGAVGFLENEHLGKGALSYTSGGSGILPCYLGVVATSLIKMGAFDTRLVQSSIDWLVQHQRFDHKATRAGGREPWPYRAPQNYGCWDSVSCYHGVAGAFRAFAAIPPEARSDEVHLRLADALEYLRIHRLYKKSSENRPLFRHLTEFFLVGDYRSDLLDMLQGVADTNPGLIAEDWVSEPVDEMRELLDAGLVPLVKNYGRKLIDPVPLEQVGEPSRFLTYQWLSIERAFAAA
jgi:hypothetical protein